MSEIVDEFVTRFARGEPMQVAERERLDRALAESPCLRETFEAQQSLSEGLHDLSRELRGLRAPDISNVLLAKVEFPVPERRPRRAARRAGWAVAATAALCAAGAIVIGVVDDAGDSTSRQAEPVIASAPRATSALNVDDYLDDFVPLGHGAALPRTAAYSIVRVRLPMSAIDMAASDYPTGQVTVEADVILGEDGIAQGIRFARADMILSSNGASRGESNGVSRAQ